MPKTLIAAALVLVTTSPQLSAGSDREELLLQLVRQNGCSMTGQDAARILPKHGFSQAESKAIEEEWLKKGWIDTSKLMTLTLTKSACGN